MGVMIGSALIFGIGLIITAPRNIVTIFDLSNCYTVPLVVQPCERVAYRAGTLNVAFNAWCGVLLLSVAAWLLWELWSSVAPKPITDDFLKLLDDSFGRNWRHFRSWPWARFGWAYGFTLVGAVSALGIFLLVSTLSHNSRFAKPAVPHIETSQQFRQLP